MESIIRQVRDIDDDQRRWIEEAVGHQLQDNQQILIRVLAPGVEPDHATRQAALDDLQQLSERGAAHRAAQGVSAEAADEALDEAMQHVRRRGPA